MGLPKSGKKYQNNKTVVRVPKSTVPKTRGYQNYANPNQNVVLHSQKFHCPPKYTNYISKSGFCPRIWIQH